MKLYHLLAPQEYRDRHAVLTYIWEHQRTDESAELTSKQIRVANRWGKDYYQRLLSNLAAEGHVEQRMDGLIGQREWLNLLTSDGVHAYTTGFHLQQGFEQRVKVVQFFGTWTALIAAAVSIAMTVYQVVKNDRLEDRIDQLEQRIERMAIPAPLDSLPTTGR